MLAMFMKPKSKPPPKKTRLEMLLPNVPSIKMEWTREEEIAATIKANVKKPSFRND
jgi:hypothetical protein